MRVVAVAFKVESVVKSLERYAIKKNFHVMYTKIMQAKTMRALRTEAQQRH